MRRRPNRYRKNFQSNTSRNYYQFHRSHNQRQERRNSWNLGDQQTLEFQPIETPIRGLEEADRSISLVTMSIDRDILRQFVESLQEIPRITLSEVNLEQNKPIIKSRPGLEIICIGNDEIVKEKESRIYSIDEIMDIGKSYDSIERPIDLFIDTNRALYRVRVKKTPRKRNSRRHSFNQYPKSPMTPNLYNKRTPNNRNRFSVNFTADADVQQRMQDLQKQAQINRERLVKPVGDLEKDKRLVKVTLNKLTDANFIKLKEQFAQICIKNDEVLGFLVEGIFQKACSETKYTDIYANLCLHLTNQYQLHQFNTDVLSGSQFKNNKFRRQLLLQVQNLFEQSYIEQSGYQNSYKKQILGNMRLIGELFKKRLISANVIIKCIKNLIKQGNSTNQAFEDSLEAVCMLMGTIGSELEHKRIQGQVDIIIRSLESIIEDGEISNRMKFLLMNLIDKRREGWQINLLN